MIKHTKDIREHICKEYDDSYDRVRYLKDQYKGQTAYIIASGPSFGHYSTEFLNNLLKDEFVISIKQTYNSLSNLVDIHLINFCNLDAYNYTNESTIVGWSVWDVNQPYQILNSGFRCDFILPTYKLGDQSPNIDNTVAVQGNFELLSLEQSLPRPWGPGTMYEMAIPLAVYTGCSSIVTIGWDLFGSSVTAQDVVEGKQDYFYKDITFKQTQSHISKKEIVSTIQSTEGLYKWLQEKQVELHIADPFNNNPACNSIPRINLGEK
jgi:hypothetical protein